METQDILNSKAVKAFIKGLLVIIGLFAALYCGIDTLVLIYQKALELKSCTIILALVSPIIAISIVLFGFLYFVKKLLFGSSGNKHVSSLIKIHNNIGQIIKVYNTVAEALESVSEEDVKILQGLLKDIFERNSKKSIEEKQKSNSNPDNGGGI
jgi:ABC-type uncharacterized transport system fused permease/ATPase subunit